MSISKRLLYDRMPEPAKDCLGLVLRRLPGFRYQPTPAERACIERLESTEFAEANELQRLQLAKLARLLDHAHQHVPYYRRLFSKLGIAPCDIHTLDELAQLPVLTKDRIRACPEDFLSDTVEDTKSLMKVTTGGSTGTPMHYYFDKHMEGVRRATWWRWSRFAGVDLYRDRMIYCGGAPDRWVYPPEDYRGMVSPTRDRLFLSSAAMSDKVLDRYIEDMRAFGGDYIRGYASGVYLLARRILERGETFRMKAVLTSSDTLFPQYRTAIEEAFTCTVFDHYGQNEDILTATECGHAPGLHINVENCIAETVDTDGRPVTDASGFLVSTHLENYVTPLIRYAVGDVGQVDATWRKCACGRSHQKLIDFVGRDDEIIVTPEGRRVGCGSMNQPMKTMYTAIQKCQFIQERRDALRVKVVPTDAWEDARDRTQLEQNVRKQVGHTIDVAIDLVDDIPPRPNGKFQFIVSHISEGT